LVGINKDQVSPALAPKNLLAAFEVCSNAAAGIDISFIFPEEPVVDITSGSFISPFRKEISQDDEIFIVRVGYPT
jgi:hypothetical protein